jgi:Spy/CpxP family protein refolding chaperone
LEDESMKNESRCRSRKPLIVCLATAAVAVSAAGCTTTVGSASADAEQALVAEDPAEVEAAEAPDEREVGHVLLRMVADSLNEVGLRPDQQQAVAAIRTDLEAATKPVREARLALASSAADGVAAGAIDDAKTEAGVRQLVAALGASKPALQDALNRLHAALDPTQRQLLVERMRARGEALRERVADQGGPGAIMRARLKRLADDLALSDSQRAAIRARVRDGLRGAAAEWGPERREQARARVKEIGEAFVRDGFDARTLDVGREAPQAAQKISAALTRFVKATLPELTPEQRAKLATIIRQKAAAAAPPTP